ncbi:MAG TPA: tetratricopeptide repeat protein [Flavobacterium sp.]|jgi:signal transduction histidine kinase
MKTTITRFALIVIITCWLSSCKKNDQEVTSSDAHLELLVDKSFSVDFTKEVRRRDGLNALKILSARENSLFIRGQLKDLADSFYKLEDLPHFKEASTQLLNESKVAGDSLHIEKAFKNLGTFYIDTNHNDSAFYYYLKAEKLALQLKQTSDLGEIYIDKAFCQLYESDFAGCEISASKALSYLDKQRHKLKIYDAYNLIGICSNELQNYEKALEYHRRALRYLTENTLNNTYHLDASSFNNIGYVYQNLNEHKKAIENFRSALRSKNLVTDNPGLYAMLVDNLAYSKYKLGDLSQLPELFFISHKIRDSLRTDISGLILNKIHLAELYATKQDTVLARMHAYDALALSRKSGVASDILLSLDQVAEIDDDKAALYSREYIKINDSLQQAERLAKDKFARIAFETEEIAYENDKLNEQNRKLLYFFVGSFMFGILLFVIRNQRAKNRELVLKQAQQKANEDIYNLMISQQNKIEEGRILEKKRIARELHDGVLGRLFGTRLNLDSLNRVQDENAIEMRNKYLAELKNIEQDIREISHDLNREKYVLINNFAAILNNLIEEQKTSHDITITTTIDEVIKWEVIDNAIKINLYRIIQEGLQNVNKYSKANNVAIIIKSTIEQIQLVLTDDGIGFEVTGKKKGIGLQNIISRTHELQGSIEIRSKKGSGTSLIVKLPTSIQIEASADV